MSRHRPIAAVLLLLLISFAGTAGAGRTEKETRFAADMARKGNWREAVYRWEKLLRDDPENPRILNNLAVASETMGEYDRAEEYYRKALALGSGLKEIRENFALFQNFYERLKRSNELVEPGVSDGKSRDTDGGADKEGASGETP